MSFKGKIATVCVAISYLVMIIAVAVSGGFRSEIRSGVSSISGDIQLIPIHQDYVSDASPIERDASYIPYIEALPEIESVNPVIYRTGIIKSGETIHGVLFKGVSEPADTTRLGVSIPRRLATILGLGVGDQMLTYFVGEKVKARKFNIVSIYDSVLDGDDKLVVRASLSDLQRLNGWDENEVSAFEILVRPAFRTDRHLKELESRVGFLTSEYVADDEMSVYSTSSVSKYPQLFDWLNLLDFNVLFILLLMTVVAGFNMISGLLIMLFENISTIGLLKSLGMRDREISKVFLLTSSSVVLKGMLIGNILALGFCLLQGQTHLLPLDPANYFVSFVPVHVNLPAILAADLLSYLVIMALLQLPTLFISRVDPARTVRVD